MCCPVLILGDSLSILITTIVLYCIVGTINDTIEAVKSERRQRKDEKKRDLLAFKGRLQHEANKFAGG